MLIFCLTYKSPNQVGRCLGVRKSVDAANRSGHSYEIRVRSSEYKNRYHLVRVKVSVGAFKAGWYRGRVNESPLSHISM